MGAGAAGWEAGIVLAVRHAAASTARLTVALALGFGTVQVTSPGAGVLAGTRDVHAVDGSEHRAVDTTTARVERLNARFGCSPRGLDEGVIPLHAVVLRDDRVRVTSFDEGWAVHLGDRPGTLLSVCAR